MDIFSFIKNRLEIVTILQNYLPLKRVGGYFRASCPFHQEKDASFTISPHKQIFFCFGCKKTGDAVGFVADIEQISQFEAALIISQKYGIEIPVEILNSTSLPEENKQKDNYLRIHKIVANWMSLELDRSSLAKEYLQDRKIFANTIKKFGIGFFPANLQKKRELLNLLYKESVLLKDLEDFGFFLSNNDRDLMSPFENRIVFPIKDFNSNVVGFGGRIFMLDDNRAKYYNSKESPYFFKKKLLFGIDIAKQHILQKKSLFITEGYFDVVSMHQAQVCNTVATMGTSLSSEHVILLERIAEEIVIFYDSDNAGISATLKLAEMTLGSRLNVKVAILPDQFKDAADFFCSNDNFQMLKTQDILDFYFETLGKNFFELSSTKKIIQLEKMLDLITKIPDPLKKHLSLQKIASLSGINIKILLQKISNAKKQVLLPKVSVQDEPLKNDGKAIELEDLLFFLSIIGLQQKIELLKIPHDFYFLFSERIQYFLKIIEEKWLSMNGVIFDELLKECHSEEEKKWLTEGFLRLDQDVVTVNMNQLLQRLLVSKTKKMFTHYERNYDLKNNEINRKAFEDLLKQIKNAHRFLTQGSKL